MYMWPEAAPRTMRPETEKEEEAIIPTALIAACLQLLQRATTASRWIQIQFFKAKHDKVAKVLDM